jgi:hypothetical protein
MTLRNELEVFLSYSKGPVQVSFDKTDEYNAFYIEKFQEFTVFRIFRHFE